ncbi:MAG: hypothetical protein ABI947_07610 [Chloroflexota bacterium]
MSKAKFAAAHELINEKNYDEARAVLETLSDPMADEWLGKLGRLTRKILLETKLDAIGPLSPS